MLTLTGSDHKLPIEPWGQTSLELGSAFCLPGLQGDKGEGFPGKRVFRPSKSQLSLLSALLLYTRDTALFCCGPKVESGTGPVVWAQSLCAMQLLTRTGGI